MDKSLQQPSGWDDLWKKHFQDYQTDVRHAFYIASLKRRRESRLLEIAAGSFRDMAALNYQSVFCEGIDFSSESVDVARSKFPDLTDRIKLMDAFHMDYKDGQWDLSYHNGLWGYFDDQSISVLGKEQARVTKSRMIATVHNGHNLSFKKKFAELSQTDPLYRIRFFQAEEVASLMKQFCRSVTVLPVGGGHPDKLIRQGRKPASVRWPFLLRSHGFKMLGRWETSERLMCIGNVAA